MSSIEKNIDVLVMKTTEAGYEIVTIFTSMPVS